MTEDQKYNELQEAKYRLRKAVEDVKKWDESLGGTHTLDGEVMPVVDEVFEEKPKRRKP